MREHHLQLYMYIRLFASTVDLFNIFIIFTVVPRPLSNDPRLNQCIYCYGRASKRFVEVYFEKRYYHK